MVGSTPCSDGSGTFDPNKDSLADATNGPVWHVVIIHAVNEQADWITFGYTCHYLPKWVCARSVIVWPVDLDLQG